MTFAFNSNVVSLTSLSYGRMLRERHRTVPKASVARKRLDDELHDRSDARNARQVGVHEEGDIAHSERQRCQPAPGPRPVTPRTRAAPST